MAKKKSTKKSPETVAPPSSRLSVDIKKANNGFVVSQWGDKGEKIYIAKNKKEAGTIANKLLKI